MGFRSTLTSFDYSTNLPEWFIEKYKNSYFINGAYVTSLFESKHYSNDFFEDYQKALKESGFFNDLKCTCVVVMGEDGVITKVVIGESSIKYIWMSDGDGFETDHVWVR